MSSSLIFVITVIYVSYDFFISWKEKRKIEILKSYELKRVIKAFIYNKSRGVDELILEEIKGIKNNKVLIQDLNVIISKYSSSEYFKFSIEWQKMIENQKNECGLDDFYCNDLIKIGEKIENHEFIYIDSSKENSDCYIEKCNKYISLKEDKYIKEKIMYEKIMAIGIFSLIVIAI